MKKITISNINAVNNNEYKRNKKRRLPVSRQVNIAH